MRCLIITPNQASRLKNTIFFKSKTFHKDIKDDWTMAAYMTSDLIEVAFNCIVLL